jgi:hypothetical protein
LLDSVAIVVGLRVSILTVVKGVLSLGPSLTGNIGKTEPAAIATKGRSALLVHVWETSFSLRKLSLGGSPGNFSYKGRGLAVMVNILGSCLSGATLITRPMRSAST